MAVSKTATNNQFARTSLTGLRTVPLPGGPDQGIEPLADEHGRLWVNVFGFPPPSPYLVSNQISIVDQSVFNVGIGPLQLNNLVGFFITSPTTPLWLHFYDSVAITAPGDIPVIVLPIPDINIEFSWSIPYVFAVGLRAIASSTPNFFTEIVGISMSGSAVYHT